jgi:hypothetical protein
VRRRLDGSRISDICEDAFEEAAGGAKTAKVSDVLKSLGRSETTLVTIAKQYGGELPERSPELSQLKGNANSIYWGTLFPVSTYEPTGSF